LGVEAHDACAAKEVQGGLAFAGAQSLGHVVNFHLGRRLPEGAAEVAVAVGAFGEAALGVVCKELSLLVHRAEGVLGVRLEPVVGAKGRALRGGEAVGPDVSREGGSGGAQPKFVGGLRPQGG